MCGDDSEGMSHAREDRPWGGLLGERRPGNVTRYAWKVPVNLGDGDSLSGSPS